MELPFSEIETERLLLDKMCITDAPEVFAIRSNPIVLKFLGRDPMKDLNEAETWIKNGLKDHENKVGINWAIRDKSTNKLIGLIGYWRIFEARNRAEIGYSLHPDYHRKGIMTEAIQTILSYGFSSLKFHSIQAEIDPFNEGSRLLLEKVGFRKEAHFTEDYLYKGLYSDSAIFSLLEKWRIK